MNNQQLLAQMAHACEQENAEKIIHLVTRRGMDVHHRSISGSTWLMVACHQKKYKTVETLLALGANPHQMEEVTIHGEFGEMRVSLDAYYFANDRCSSLLDRAQQIRLAWELGQMASAKQLTSASPKEML